MFDYGNLWLLVGPSNFQNHIAVFHCTYLMQVTNCGLKLFTVHGEVCSMQFVQATKHIDPAKATKVPTALTWYLWKVNRVGSRFHVWQEEENELSYACF